MKIKYGILILFSILLGVMIFLFCKKTSYEYYDTHDFIEYTLNNAISGSEKKNKDECVLRFKFQKSVSEKENILAFLRSMDCEYRTDEEIISLNEIIGLIDESSNLGKQRENVLCKSVRLGGSFKSGNYNVAYLSYNPSGKKHTYCFFEILYTDCNELVFSRTIRYGKFINDITTNSVEEQFNMAMKIE